jgi:hypothetical protein
MLASTTAKHVAQCETERMAASAAWFSFEVFYTKVASRLCDPDHRVRMRERVNSPGRKVLRQQSAACLMWESEMLTDVTEVGYRGVTQPLIAKRRKPLHGWFAAALFLAGVLAGSGVTAANGEQFCTHGGQNPQQGDSVACYSDTGCRFAATLGADPVRGYDPSSAPFALARGKITGIITSSSGLIAEIRKVGGSCRGL